MSADDSYQLLPVDEGVRDQEFVNFRSELLAVVLAREPEVFVTMMDQQILNGLHEPRGMKQFLKKWEPDSIDSELWATLEHILTMGGGFVRSEKGVEFCAPYVFSHFPDNLDIFAYGAVIGGDVALKAEPSASSATQKYLSYDLLTVLDWVSTQDESGSGESWLKVTTLKGDKGYVDRQLVRSPSDYSVCFLKTDNRGWKINSLLTRE
ncbi:MAG: hypothetical protein OEM38_09065 [Gammaproteobacteria bacterium]|nr:hypothetical protein [Gammaproteobacteria bacterium]